MGEDGMFSRSPEKRAGRRVLVVFLVPAVAETGMGKRREDCSPREKFRDYL